MSGHRSEQCWAASRHLPVACPLRETCEATTRERDALRSEVARLHAMNLALAERCTGQSEALTIRAERTTADDLRDGEGEG